MAFAAKYLAEGDRIDYTPGSDVDAGDVVVLESLVGVAVRDIAANTQGALVVRGLVECDIELASTSRGTVVYWDESENRATETATNNTKMGFVVEPAASDGGTGRVLLTPLD
ncbi:MAG: DUF2190 family protein [Pseudomonadota bacterium]